MNDAVRDELQQMAQQQPSAGANISSEPDDNSDFWASIGDEFDAEDKGLEPKAAEQEVSSETETTPPPEEKETETPATAEQPPQTPAQTEDQPEQQQPQISPEEAKRAAEQWQKDLEAHFSSELEEYGEDFSSEFMSEPGKFLPKLQAKAVSVALKNAFEMIQHQMPVLEQRMIQNSVGVINATIAKRAFYRKHPALAAHEGEFDKFFQKYRTVADPATPISDVADEAAQVFMRRKGIQTQQKKPAPTNAPPPPPVSSGVSPSAPKENENPWAKYAEELISIDDDF